MVGVRDPVIRIQDSRVGKTNDAWEASVCSHPLDEADAEDRMRTAYATSGDGVRWTWRGTALEGRPGTWDARGAGHGRPARRPRLVRRARDEQENFAERTGLARSAGERGRLVACGDGPVADGPVADGPVADGRYLDVVALQDGGYRLYYAASREDGSHELRTEVVS
jgi:hypothetical protein